MMIERDMPQLKDAIANQKGFGSLNAPTSCREITRALQELAESTMRMESITSRFACRLESVMSAPTPACSEMAQPTPYQTDLARSINGSKCTIQNLLDQMENMLDRIEL